MESNTLRKRNAFSGQRRYDICFALFLLCGIGLYLYRLPYGMADVDETFYLSIPYRLVQGEALLVDEWHVSQLAGFLLYPILWLYLKIAGTTQGIILAFRYIYLAFQIVAAVGVYAILRRYRLAAVGSALLFFLFTPFNITALSYNSMGLAFVLLFALLLFASPRQSKGVSLLAGLFCACGVLCNPYFIIVYFLYGLACLCFAFLLKRRACNVPAPLRMQSFLWLTLGAGLLAVLFAAILFSRASLQEVLDNLPNVVSDPAHPPKTLQMICEPILSFIKQYIWYVAVAVCLPLLARFDRNAKRRAIYVALSILLAVGMSFYFALAQTTRVGMNAVMLPLAGVGVTAYAAERREKAPLLLCGWWVGVLYAVCMVLSSNQYMYVVSNALVVSDVFSVLLLFHFCTGCGLFTKKWTAVLPLVFLLFCQYGAQIYVKTHHVFWDQPIPELTATVPSGPVKGLRSTPARVERHVSRLADLDAAFSDVEGVRVHFFRNMPYAYLYTGAAFGTSTAWGSENETLDSPKLERYYQLHPDHVPELIYVEPNVAVGMDWQVWQTYADAKGYRLEQMPSGALRYVRQAQN